MKEASAVLARMVNMGQAFTTNQSDAEREVRKALARYKLAMVNCHYRNWWHRLSVWMGEEEAIAADRELNSATSDARSICLKSNEHTHWLHVISSQQPDTVREKDNLLALIR